MSLIRPSELQKKKYYKINTYKAIKDEKQALNDIEELLFKSVELRLNSDVEVASLIKWWN
jgi:asparagine synthase (glutamine-hydrolysing)